MKQPSQLEDSQVVTLNAAVLEKLQQCMDTTSNISIVRPDILSQDQRSVCIKPVDNSLHAVTAAVKGKARQQLKLGSSTVAYDMWIANMLNKCSVDLDPYGCLVACESEKWKPHCRNPAKLLPGCSGYFCEIISPF